LHDSQRTLVRNCSGIEVRLGSGHRPDQFWVHTVSLGNLLDQLFNFQAGFSILVQDNQLGIYLANWPLDPSVDFFSIREDSLSILARESDDLLGLMETIEGGQERKENDPPRRLTGQVSVNLLKQVLTFKMEYNDSPSANTWILAW
jgi:hypothetical protein